MKPVQPVVPIQETKGFVNDDSPAIEVETGSHPVASIIWLHGLGADGHDFEPIIPELDLSRLPALRFVFPHAPYRSVTLNGGQTMRAWYDIWIDGRGIRQDENDIRESEQQIEKLIDRECDRGIDIQQILLAGFSQGAAMALHTGLRYRSALAGIMALSMPIPLPDRISTEINPANTRVPIFLAHGLQDQVVPYAMGEFAHQLLEEIGLPVEWHSYNMGHSVSREEITDISNWLARIIN